jgi:hypothetical protein
MDTGLRHFLHYSLFSAIQAFTGFRAIAASMGLSG